MAILKLAIEPFLQQAETHLVLDVRSPGEYAHAHIPGAINLPLFSDEERKVVGTAYKQQGKQEAIKTGLGFFGGRMREMVETVENLAGKHAQKSQEDTEPFAMGDTTSVLVHCWRGGMRSAGVAWLLDLYGFKVHTLIGGYKAYRGWVRNQFDYQYPFNIIGGYTGSGKTLLLHELKKRGEAIIDLEGIAHHKGSAFGGIGEVEQPTQEMFENRLATELYGFRKRSLLTSEDFNSINRVSSDLPESASCIYIEDESQRIGSINLPAAIWEQLRKGPVSFLAVPFDARLNYLTEVYGSYEKNELLNAVLRIQKRLGGLETKNASTFLLEGNPRGCFEILLRYYDKCYNKGLEMRNKSRVNNVLCSSIDLNFMINALTNEKTIV